jgi:hypothetical protein
MEPLWRIQSGKFAGWRSNDRLYNAKGKNVGFFDKEVAYSLNGRYIGEIYRDVWIGKKSAIIHSTHGAHAPYADIALAPYANRAGIAIAGWEDSEF